MEQFIIGLLAAAACFGIIEYTRQTGLKLQWWEWTLTVLCWLYCIFVVELIVVFLAEGATQGAAVMGFATGLIAVIWVVLLARFVFLKSGKATAA